MCERERKRERGGKRVMGEWRVKGKKSKNRIMHRSRLVTGYVHVASLFPV